MDELAATVLSYATIGDYFPAGLAARAKGALNLLHFAWAFAVQYGVGLAISPWSLQDGHYPAVAYRIAFGLSLVFQAAALLWFGLPPLRTQVARLYASFIPQPANDSDTLRFCHLPAEGAVLVGEGGEW